MTKKKADRDSVYILMESENDGPTGYYKIGYTSGVTESRIKTYRAGNHRTVTEYYVVSVTGGTGNLVESQIHAKFFQERQKNRSAGDEWFALTPEKLREVIIYMSTFDSDRENLVPSLAWGLDRDPMAREPIGTTDFTPPRKTSLPFVQPVLALHNRHLALFRANQIRYEMCRFTFF